MFCGRAAIVGLAVAAALAMSGCASESGSSGTSSVPHGQSTNSELAPEDQVAKDLGVEGVDDVAVIREVSPDEAGKAHATCMTDAGWEAVADDYGAVDYGFAKDQEGSFNLAYATCLQQYPIASKYTVPLTDEQYGLIYDYLTDSAIPCLEDRGYDVESPPSRGVYIDTAETPAVYLVNVAIYDAVLADVDAGRWDDAEQVFQRVCPILPPDDVLYGG